MEDARKGYLARAGRGASSRGRNSRPVSLTLRRFPADGLPLGSPRSAAAHRLSASFCVYSLTQSVMNLPDHMRHPTYPQVPRGTELFHVLIKSIWKLIFLFFLFFFGVATSPQH